MVNSGLVFIGPSLPDRPGSGSVHYRPPAVRGDLLRASREGFGIIGLVDGEFHQSLAVSPSEVMAASREGVALLGAASIGSLRACECPRAMRGIGTVFEQFRDGRLRSDDEVATTYDPITYDVIAHPLVNIRATLDIALRKHLLDKREHDRILWDVAMLPFMHRVTSTVRTIALEHSGRLAAADEFVLILGSECANVKRRDALLLVGEVTRLCGNLGTAGDVPAADDLR